MLSLYISFIPKDLSSCSRNANYLGNLDTMFVSIIDQIRTELIGLPEEKAAFVDEVLFISHARQPGQHLSLASISAQVQACCGAVVTCCLMW